MTIKVFEAFSGIGAQAEALKELNLDYKVVGISEIDKFAIKGYEAIHGPVKNYGNIKDIERIPDCDLLTYSYPCTSISINGRQEGMKEGSDTASSLVWEIGRILKNCKTLPNILLMENVDAVLNNRNKNDFTKWIRFLDELGYTSTYKILNAKDFGLPQNRKRCFMISIKDGGRFIFPTGSENLLVLEDLLESTESEPAEFYLNDDKMKNYEEYKITIDPHRLNKVGDLHKYSVEYMNRVYSIKGLSPCIQTLQGGGRMPKIKVKDGVRYLTPRECLRLQGFSEHLIDELEIALKSKTQLYKVAGNTIAIPCLKEILRGIYIDKTFEKNTQIKRITDY